ncbi:hypothetical protein GCM10007392_07420 [Saccharospirillum salsuginis]|uniref:HTH arsR-type domain-containing protein n=2 Tax=Saccharospirillum salsuginis TaxID=418750 RepID=A0A918N7B5_9GAMM|nr:hypothetical protein GCM10007392_07420 [Saccharospirillum salsuginis]
MLAMLSRGSATVSELAAPFDMSLPAASKHLKVLENAQLVIRTKSGRVQTCTFQPDPMAHADQWLEHYRVFWNNRLESLKSYLEDKDSDT